MVISESELREYGSNVMLLPNVARACLRTLEIRQASFKESSLSKLGHYTKDMRECATEACTECHIPTEMAPLMGLAMYYAADTKEWANEILKEEAPLAERLKDVGTPEQRRRLKKALTKKKGRS